MSKLYFKYGTMGSSKTANALMCKFNYEQQGFSVLLLKPKKDTRDIENGEYIVKSRIGLKSVCVTFTEKDNLEKLFSELNNKKKYDVIIIDECQFASREQINQLKSISEKVDVLCYGLLTDFKTELFEGSKRLIELADSLKEIKSMCKCGKKASVNARFINGNIVTDGDVVAIENANNVKYEPMCYYCFKKLKNN